MKKNINLIILSLLTMVGCVFTSCNDEETTKSRAVLASTSVLEFDVIPADAQIITVTSDGDWTVEAPEFVTVSPMNGTMGQTEVVISMGDNMREGAPDNPRKGNVLFKGRNMEGTATVLVKQDGDKWRDPKEYSIEDIESAPDETVVLMRDMVVTALTSSGYMVNDGNKYMYVLDDANIPAVGDKLNILGEKKFDENKMSVVEGYQVTHTGTGTVPTSEPLDITSLVDTDAVKVTSYSVVKIDGNYDGSVLTIPDANNNMMFKDEHSSVGLKNMMGHKVTVTGFLAGYSAPTIFMIPLSVEDRGLNETVYFFDDFEWLSPWVEASAAGDQFGKFSSGETCPQMQNAIFDGVSAFDALIAKGYEYVYVGSDPCAVLQGSKYVPSTLDAKDCTYLQSNYLKFGKTACYAGLVLPPLKDVEEGVDLLMTFDWGPMMSGKGNWDDTLIVVVVETDGEINKFPIPAAKLTHGESGDWQKATVDLAGIKVNSNSKITIRNIDDHWPLDDKYGKTGLVRYFLDNIKIKAQ